MSRFSPLRSFTAAAAIVALPLGQAAAQSCLGQQLDPNQKSVSLALNDYGDMGGGGGRAGMVTKSNVSFMAQVTKHDIDMGSAEFKPMYMFQARGARPVFRNTTWGSSKSGSGTCMLLEFGGSSFEGTSATNAGIGLGYAINASRVSFYGAPVIGMVQSGEFNDSYVNLLVGASTRFGAIVLGADVTMPVEPEGGTNNISMHLGFAWGKATQIPATPVRPAAQSSSAAQSAMPATNGSTGPTAGVKPYSVDDVEAMIKNTVSSARIVELSKRACLSFRMTEEAETRLRRVGADVELLTGLRQSCYSAS